MGALERVFDPRSIAVIGASNDPEKRGYRAMLDLVDSAYDGAVYPVNPNQDRIFERPAYDTVVNIPSRVDLAFIAIPAAFVPDAIRECGKKGVAGAVINTAGFGEIGEETLEEQLADAATEAGVRIIGPNIEGVDFAHQNVHLLGGIRTTPGHLGMLTQSGNMGHQLSVDAQDSGNVGFSYNIGVGNETDIGFHEYLDFLGGDDLTNGVVAYVEGMKDGRAFLQEARRVSREKPIVIQKSGRTSAGKGSAKSHTASIAGDIDVLESAYRQAGVQPVESVDLLVPVAEALTNAPIPEGPRVAVLTDGGGHATATADALKRKGLELPELSTETQTTLEEIYQLSPSLDNPVDVMGSADHEVMWYETARYILEDPNVDALLIAGAALGYEECWDGKEGERDPKIARKLADLVDELGKPVVFASMWEELGCSTALEHLAANGVPVYERIDIAVAALRALADYGTHLAAAERKTDFVLGDGPNANPTVSAAVDADRGTLSEYESRELLSEYGAPVAPFELAETAAEAQTTAAGFDGPVAMKIVSRDIVHKSEAGGVELDIEGETAVSDTFDRILRRVNEYAPEAETEGVLVSPMVGEGVELIVGVADDPEIGPVITCGLGGILVEALADAAFRALPVTQYDAREMLEDIGAQSLLEGPRNLPAVDRDELVDLIRAVSELVSENPAIRELDMNPVIATSDGLSVVDASIEIETQ